MHGFHPGKSGRGRSPDGAFPTFGNDRLIPSCSTELEIPRHGIDEPLVDADETSAELGNKPNSQEVCPGLESGLSSVGTILLEPEADPHALVPKVPHRRLGSWNGCFCQSGCSSSCLA